MIEFGVTSIRVGILPKQPIAARIENRVLTAVLEGAIMGKRKPTWIRLALAGHNLLRRVAQ